MYLTSVVPPKTQGMQKESTRPPSSLKYLPSIHPLPSFINFGLRYMYLRICPLYLPLDFKEISTCGPATLPGLAIFFSFQLWALCLPFRIWFASCVKNVFSKKMFILAFFINKNVLFRGYLD